MFKFLGSSVTDVTSFVVEILASANTVYINQVRIALHMRSYAGFYCFRVCSHRLVYVYSWKSSLLWTLLLRQTVTFILSMFLINTRTYTYIMTLSDQAWNFDSTTGACSTISDDLDLFSTWRKKQRPTVNGIYHLLTNCYPSPGTVGLSWMGTLCSNYQSTGTGFCSYAHPF
jgi:hypothetical protein